jgi:2,3-dihydro-2,3-dihydroxybenzoate dehydrogenase
MMGSADITPKFRGKVAVVSGAAQGIGAAVVDALAARGAAVALLDVQPCVEDCARQLSQHHGRQMLGIALDISDSAAVTDAVATIEATFGPIAILVNVAGILRMDAVLDISSEDWQRTFAVNTHGVFHLSTAVARYMVQRRCGSIITVGSNAANVPRARMAAYAASKAAAHQFTRCLGLELAAYGIRCNIVSPGSTDTPMQRQLWTSPDAVNSILHGSPADFRLGIPLQRIATPQDIATSVCFLASDEARHITLHDLRVDGGATLDA